VKAGVFGQDGKLLALSRRSFKPTISRDGHVDIPIDVVYKSARETVREAVGKSRAKILAMAVSSQGETFVTLDKDDHPLHNAIMWYDSRADRQAEELCSAVYSAAGRKISIDAIMTVSKIRWLQEHRPAIMRKARRFILLPDYLAYRLTGLAAIDAHTAASTGLLMSDEDKYDPAVLEAGRIDLSQLSTILIPGTPIGKIKKTAAADWGLSPETLLVTGTNDQYAGALGAGNCRPGILSETSGTCLALVTLTKKQPRNLPAGLLGGKFPIPDHWFILAYSKTAGLVLDWFRKIVAAETSFEELNEAAKKVPVGSNGLCMVPHFDGMISPTPNQRMRGAFIGLSLHHGRAHMYRSILEALTFNIMANIQIMQSRGLNIEVIRSIGGGAANPLWRQIKADAAGLPVELPAVPEAATLGAAMLAAYGRGDFNSLEETSSRFYHCRAVVKPDLTRHGLYREAYENYSRILEHMAAVYA